MAISKGSPTAPGWIQVLDTAAAWGRAPWEFAKIPKPIIWWIRKRVYDRIHAKTQRDKIRKLER